MRESLQKAYIIGSGAYLPKNVLKNTDLEKLVDTSDEWITTRTGMKERRIADKDEYTSDMGYEAAKESIENAGISPLEIDLILVATLSPDYIFPSTACMIQEKLGAKNAAAMDIMAACTGMIYALSVAKAYVRSGIYKNILVVASEKLSSIVNYQDRNTCVLFGDGAAALVVSNEKPGLQIKAAILGSDGGHSQLISLPAGGCRKPASIDSVNNREHFLQMDGREVFKHAVRKMESAAIEVIEKAGMQESDISYLVPHQANIRIIDAIAKRCKISHEKIVTTIERYGNTSASSLGISLHELIKKGTINSGENLLLVAFGSGLTWGSMVLTATKDEI